jgi:hypothetical protein
MDRKLLLREEFTEIELLTENTSEGKKLYIEGTFAQAEVKNGNRRFYPKPVLEKSTDVYIENYLKKNRAGGELNHPDRPFIDPKEVGIVIENLSWHGNNVEGKARVLNTTNGKTIAALMEGGFSLGVSTRGLGTLRESNGINYVEDGYMMTAVDVVDNPSGPNCYVNPILESSWYESNGVWLPASTIIESKLPVNEELFLEKLELLLKSLKSKK